MSQNNTEGIQGAIAPRRRKTRSYQSRQLQYAREALAKIVDRSVKPVMRRRGYFQIRTGPENWRLDQLDDSFAYLRDKTGVGLPIDPFESPEQSAWFILLQSIWFAGFKSIANEIAAKYLETIYLLQVGQRRRADKSAAFYWLSETFRELGQNDVAKGCILLAIAEKVISGESSSAVQSYNRLTAVLGLLRSSVDSMVAFLKERAKERKEQQLGLETFPEQGLVQWELEEATGLTFHSVRR